MFIAMVGDGQRTKGSNKSAMIYKPTRFDIHTKEKMAPFNLKLTISVQLEMFIVKVVAKVARLK